ncbi:GNAT family N-acetyltransferase [Tropicimonas sp. TH_r6]|uniref:GNAT family N-acetyltransferase n=1 Tax=Tropicimonas sp. TH_r6 TaxID=3082085 RepID=UPI002954DF34|nr:GNAT family N-acetyltransferase [Tropicimonas sp. TH_r6]MDV7142517.1 GNAT family N-acetyltransferase [Tropicimonas sp. TH_r6]
MTDAPLLVTERLMLRAQRPEDFEPFAEMLASERSVYMGGPTTRKTAWLWFAADSGAWPLMNLGGWTIERRTDGAVLGQVAVNKPDFYPEIEIGWMLYTAHLREGYAFEAAAAARDWAFGPRGLTTLVSYVDPPNARSIALAERLGATRDDEAPRPDPGDLVYRHPHPGRAA